MLEQQTVLPTPTRSASIERAATGFLWASTVPLVFATAWLLAAPSALLLSSLAAAGFGLFVFLQHGGRRITAVGLYSLSLAIFVGFAGIWYVMRQPTAITDDTVLAANVALAAHVATWLVFWRTPSEAGGVQHPAVRSSVPRWGVIAGVMCFASGEVLVRRGYDLGTFPQSTAFVGSLLAATSLLAGVGARRARRRVRPLRIIAASGAFMMYVGTVFTGSGRLIIAVLGVAMAIVAGTFTRPLAFKLALAASIVPALVIFGAIRSSGEATHGLGSVVEPLTVFGDIIRDDRAGAIHRSNGSTFLVSLVAQVPRSVWPAKPDGFGTVLTAHFNPDLLDVGHSMAALMPGEWWWNFGPLGIAAMIPATGLALRWLDRLLAKAQRRGVRTRRDLLYLVATATAVSGVLDLYWVGTFTYAARTVTRLLVIGLILGPLALYRRSDSAALTPS